MVHAFVQSDTSVGVKVLKKDHASLQAEVSLRDEYEWDIVCQAAAHAKLDKLLQSYASRAGSAMAFSGSEVSYPGNGERGNSTQFNIAPNKGCEEDARTATDCRTITLIRWQNSFIKVVLS